ncbi:MAG: antitoxin [Veillonella sp.]|uniref:DUF6290 family protein n=1 Tax=Veillonella sp. TaxID=1926307 RepID=UPI0025D18505|nr:DUF6290 family protein [Veillonella sp.]MBE6079746.1 antitoxin [Veillonella sp.]
MKTISFHVTDEEYRLIQDYIKQNNLELSSFIVGLLLDKIEGTLELDEARILNAKELTSKEENFSSEKVWNMLEL